MSFVKQVISESNVEPRPYQRKIIKKTTDMFMGRYLNVQRQPEQPARSVMIESPTGSGKTVMGHMVAKALQYENPGLVVGWVAMRRNLLSQAASENAGLGINVADIHYVSMFDKEPMELCQARRDGKKILMVVDEAQHDAASSMAHLHNLIEPDWILGLTATPFRTDRVKLCFDKVVKDAGIHQLIQDGYLSRYCHYTIPEWTPETVADHYCSEPERWGKSVVFFHQWDDVLRFQSIILEREVEIRDRLGACRSDMPLSRSLVEVVKGGGTKSDYNDRDRLLDDFRNGEVGVLVNCMVLTEGFDAPSLETAFVRDSVKGPTMQMAGRAFRMHPVWKDGGDSRFRFKNIVQSRHTKWPILKTAMADRQYLWQENSWRSLTLNPHLEEINHKAKMAIAQTEVSLPKFIVDRQAKAPRRLRFR